MKLALEPRARKCGVVEIELPGSVSAARERRGRQDAPATDVDRARGGGCIAKDNPALRNHLPAIGNVDYARPGPGDDQLAGRYLQRTAADTERARAGSRVSENNAILGCDLPAVLNVECGSAGTADVHFGGGYIPLRSGAGHGKRGVDASCTPASPTTAPVLVSVLPF